MPQLKITAAKMVADARERIEEIGAKELVAQLGARDLVIVDIRDLREREREGIIPGSVHAPRGMLEAWIDPQSPYHKDVFAQDKKYLFFCAGGMRSALAAQTAQRMGLKPVCHMEGGFGAWKKAGAPVDEPEAKW